MLKQVADGVFVHESEFIQSNSVAVEGQTGALLIDPGITGGELATIAKGLGELGQPVVAGFSTHPDWDHVLWHRDLGDAPRYGTARGAAYIAEVLASADWEARVAEMLPPEYVDDIPKDLLGRISGLPEGTTRMPWDGPSVRIIEHRAHAVGHAALVIEESRVLVAGDMLSDILVPFIDLEADDPLGDYDAALDIFEALVGDVDVVVPGHGSVCDAEQLRKRITLDRAYLQGLRDGAVTDDPRVGPSAPIEWLADIHEWHLQQLAQKN